MSLSLHRVRRAGVAGLALLLAAAAAAQAPSGEAAPATPAAQSMPSPQPGNSPASSPASAARPADPRVGQAIAAPLSDLNLVRAEIPPALLAALKTPYAPPAEASCPAIAAEVQALDAALGADLDTPQTASNPSLIERGSSAAGDAIVGAVRSTAEGVIPFRGWVRKLTGAERYAREVQAAIAAGTVRRAYLKGLGEGLRCGAPAAPRRGAAG